MNILDELENKALWNDFFAYKKNGNHLPKAVAQDFLTYIKNEEYLPVVRKIKQGGTLSDPVRTMLNKKHSDKKRVVFTFNREENYVLKMLSFLLHKYDGLFFDNLYSFRQKIGVKNAFSDIVNHPEIDMMYCYKADIHDYFNSVDTEIMTALLEEKIKDDPVLTSFLKGLLKNPFAVENGERQSFKKGVMAGVPVSGFLANLYLSELDEYFFKNNVLYARYSDDIIIFAPTLEEIEAHEKAVKDFLKKRRLEINPRKEGRTLPKSPWSFLGFSYCNGEIDISPVAFNKLKGKMRRKARALLRWKTKNSATDERAIRAFIRHFNKKLFDNPIHNDITWCRWYFPLITTDKTLYELDAYMLSCIRYIASGKHTKANYNLRYETIKAYGYKSLVNSYYKR